jgi:hypothetical protein
MKRAIPLMLLLALASSARAQQAFGNEWINYDARYWAFWVGTTPTATVFGDEGLWRIDSLTLANAGFPVGTVDARRIQVFGREKQVPIYFPGDTDQVFNGTDFIELYIPKNDGWLDSALWDDPEHINNPYYSIVGDSIQYFITWDAEPTSLRIHDRAPGNWNSIPQRPWYWAESIYTNPQLYRKGRRDVNDVTASFTGDGEGYFQLDWLNDGPGSNSNDGPFDIAMPTPFLYDNILQDPCPVTVVVAGTNSASRQANLDHHLQIRAGLSAIPQVDTAWTAERTLKFNFNLLQSQNQLDAPNTNFRFTIVHDLPLNGGMQVDYPDRQALAYIRVEYQHLFTGFESEDIHMYLPNNGESMAALRMASNWQPLLYVYADSVYRITPENSPPTWNTLVPLRSAADRTHIYVCRPSNTRQVPAFYPVRGTGYFTDYASTPVDSALVIVTHPKLMDGAMQYANYRQSTAYNRYNTLVADVTELYQQYGGGVLRHPLGIRRFVGHLLSAYEHDPQALFLIGKATQAPKLGGGDNTGHRSHTVQDSLVRRLCMVPSFGFPPSDALLTLGLSGDPWDLTVPVGRLAAITNDQVLAYLAKVQALEAQQQQPAAWMKNILHFRGGFTPQENILFGSYLQAYQDIVEDTTYFSGRVTNFVKNPDELISQAAADSVYNLVSEGVTLMTFFAHASGGGFDISIDQPGNYQWNGRHPMVIGNSCYTGNLHLPSSGSASEQFVLAPNAGAAAFLASIDLGVTGYLYNMTSAFYQSFAEANYGRSIGRHMQYMDSVALFVTDPGISITAGVQQFTLHGDPTLILNSPAKPDFEITPLDVSIRPDPVTADADSFQVVTRVRNIGRGTGSAFTMAAQRWMQEEGIELPPVVRQHQMVHWQDTLTFTLPVLADSGGTGLNLVQVRADLDPDQIPEYDDQVNNSASLPMLITTGDLVPVDPFNFAITPDPSPTLQASTGDPFAPVRTYVIQIDTTDQYNSPVMEQATIQAPGGVVSWTPSSIYALNQLQDSLVFYWRCSIDSVGNGGYEWREFSFQHINGRKGWGQAHYFQFKGNNYNNLVYDRPQREWDFYTGERNIGCITQGGSVVTCKWTKDLVVQEGGGCGGEPALHLAVVDPLTFIPWTTRWQGTGYFLNANNDQGGGDNGCVLSYRSQKRFMFKQNQPGRLTALANALNDTIPDGSFILLYTYIRLNRPAIDASPLAAALASLGADQYAAGTVPDGVPYIFFCQKGNPDLHFELYGGATAQIDTSIYLPVTGDIGNMGAPAAGPFLSWDALHWEVTPNMPSDSATITLNTVDAFGQSTPLLALPAATTDSLDLVAAGITQQDLERLQLEARLFSDTLFTDPRPAQPVRWQLVGSPAPECAIDPPLGFYTSLDSLYEGQTARVMVAVHNISDVPMDSLLIGAWVTNAQNQRRTVHWHRNAPLPVNGVVLDTVAFNLAGLAGANALVIEANPRDTVTQLYDQREMYHFNNIATLRFETFRDRQNPVLDATFDGLHILDGDIVSARPEIRITLDDENPTLLFDDITDTTRIKVFLTRPGATGPERVWFRVNGEEQLQFVPTQGAENVCHAIWRPVFAQDGAYTLQVQAADISGNSSGNRDMTVRFEVVNKPTITEVLNYPNPFTTSTRFVFTLTGSETPTAMRIRIMTVTGRVVREIMLNELGPLRVGRNITEFAWDGTDQFGDRLGQGVYLYQVTAQLNGQDIEQRETAAGGLFTKGFGKMYLLR